MKVLLIFAAVSVALVAVVIRGLRNRGRIVIPDSVRTGDVWVTIDYLMTQLEGMILPGIATEQLEQRFAWLLSHVHATGYFKGYRGYPSLISASLNDEVVHSLPSKRQLREGDILKLECGIRKRGQHAFIGWTYPVGEVPPSVKVLLARGRMALDAGVTAVCDGVPVETVSRAMALSLQGHGLNPSRDFLGFGIGAEAHMLPPIPCFASGHAATSPRLHRAKDYVLLVVAHEGSAEVLVKSDGWTVFSKDGGLSVLFSKAVSPTVTGRIERTRSRMRDDTDE